MSQIGRAAVALVAVATLVGLAGCAPEASAAATTSVPTAIAPGSVVSVVTIGDSIMSGYQLGAGDDWPTLVGMQTGTKIENLACPGAGFVAVGSCDTDFAGLVVAAASLSPKLVIIESSSNDMDDDDAEVAAATARTVDQLAAVLPHATIVGLSTIWNDDATVPASVTASSDALRSAVVAVGGTFVDVGQPLQGHPDLMQSDDVHPTTVGQQLIAQTVLSRLQGEGVDLP